MDRNGTAYNRTSSVQQSCFPLFFVLVFKNIGEYVFLSGFVSLFTLFHVILYNVVDPKLFFSDPDPAWTFILD
jgi:hypothetical protein